MPLFAIGVFVGFTIAQFGMVKHWREQRGRRLAMEGDAQRFRAVLTFVAAIVTTATKFTEGAWMVVVALPLLVVLMQAVQRNYRRIGDRLELGRVPDRPGARRSRVVVPVNGVSKLTRDALSVASGLGHDVVAVHAVNASDPDDVRAFNRLLTDWERWNPGVPLVALADDRRRLTDPIVRDYVQHTETSRRVFGLHPRRSSPRAPVRSACCRTTAAPCSPTPSGATPTRSSAASASVSAPTSRPPNPPQPWSPSARASDPPHRLTPR